MMDNQVVIEEVKDIIDDLLTNIEKNNNNYNLEKPTITNGFSKDKDKIIAESICQQQNEKLQNNNNKHCPVIINNQQESINSESIVEPETIVAICKRPKIEEDTPTINNNNNNDKSTLDKPKADLTIVPSNDIIETDEKKEMVELRNLEISPPPLPPPQLAQIPPTPQTQLKEANDDEKKDIKPNDEKETPAKKARNNKRKLTQSSTPDSNRGNNEEAASVRSKRQRTQTRLFQAGDIKQINSIQSGSSSESPSPVKVNRQPRTANKGRKKSTTSSNCSEANISYNAQDTVQERHNSMTNDLQDVIFYEKNDYLAIRNEENTFYLCQLIENVRSVRPMIKIKWLDTKDEGKTYFLTAHYDKVPHKSIIMPVSLNKLKSEKKGEQIFTLDDQDRENIMDRLQRSVIASQHHLNSSQESSVTEYSTQ